MKRLPIVLTLGIALAFLVIACESNVFGPEATSPSLTSASTIATTNAPTIVRVVADHGHGNGDYQFELLDENDNPIQEIPSGWTTFQLDNMSSSTHFAFLAQVPKGAIDGAKDDNEELLDYWIQHVTNPFQWFMDDMLPDKDPNPDDLPTKYIGSFFPGWFGEGVPSGGPGFTSGHTTSTTTVYLEEGYYIVECYVKNADGDFHSYLGMIDLLTVNGDNGTEEAPEHTLELTLSSTDGIVFDGHVPAGEHIVKVHFEDQAVYEHLLGHDVHLITQGHGQSAPNKLGAWMNWMDPGGLVSSSQSDLGPQTFLGGVQTLAAKRTAYFHIDLAPGRYTWVGEVPDPADKGFMKSFTVSQSQGRAAR